MLVPRTTVFRQKDLWSDQPLRVGRTPEHVALLARAAESSPVTSAVLSNGQREGDELRWHTNRDYLLRAVQLGFLEIELFGNETPAVCRDAQRVYVWSLLPAVDAFLAGENPVEWVS